MSMNWFLIDTILMIIFAAQHSLLTTKTAVTIFNRLFPDYMWNFLYSILTIILAIFIFRFWAESEIYVYKTTGFLSVVIFSFQILSVVMFFYCFKYTTSFWQWIGIEQLYKKLTRRSMSKYYRLRKNGLKKHIRFPHHSFLILIFWFQSTMTLDSLYLAIFATIYTYIGTVHQDMRGIRLVGKDWIEYRKETNLLFPNIQKAINIFKKK